MCVCMCVWMHVCVYACRSVCRYGCMYVYVHVCMYVCVYVCLYALCERVHLGVSNCLLANQASKVSLHKQRGCNKHEKYNLIIWIHCSMVCPSFTAAVFFYQLVSDSMYGQRGAFCECWMCKCTFFHYGCVHRRWVGTWAYRDRFPVRHLCPASEAPESAGKRRKAPEIALSNRNS